MITTLCLIGWLITGVVAWVRIRTLKGDVAYAKQVGNLFYEKFRQADDQRYKAYKLADEQRETIAKLSAEVKQQGNR